MRGSITASARLYNSDGAFAPFQSTQQLNRIPAMFKELEQGLTLPDPAERREILQHASLLLARARLLLDQLDVRPEHTGAGNLRRQAGENSTHLTSSSGAV